MAYNEELDSTNFYTATAVWAHLDHAIVTLTIDGERIETTAEHPFFISADRWVAAGDLRLGARVRQADGTYGTVEAIEVQRRPQVMYNITVAEAHTYFVGDGEWLVHNQCPDGGNASGGKLQRRLWKITKENTYKVMVHKGFGPISRHKGTRHWWARDKARHGQTAKSVWKVFEETEKGLQHVADADKYGNFIKGKYKGPIGEFIPWKDLRGR